MNPSDTAAFLTNLAGFFEAAPAPVDDALAAHFGIDTACDWVIAGLELAAEALPTPHPQGAPA